MFRVLAIIVAIGVVSLRGISPSEADTDIGVAIRPLAGLGVSPSVVRPTLEVGLGAELQIPIADVHQLVIGTGYHSREVSAGYGGVERISVRDVGISYRYVTKGSAIWFGGGGGVDEHKIPAKEALLGPVIHRGIWIVGSLGGDYSLVGKAQIGWTFDWRVGCNISSTQTSDAYVREKDRLPPEVKAKSCSDTAAMSYSPGVRLSYKF